MVRLKKVNENLTKVKNKYGFKREHTMRYSTKKTHANNDNSEKSTGGALPEIVSHEIVKMQIIKRVHKILKPV